MQLMNWVTSIHQAIQYIEEHLREELTIREVAQQAALSPFYFQKGFARFHAQVPQCGAEHFGTGGGKFENGAQNQDYYCEVWTPVERNKINRFSKKIQDYDKNRNFDTIDIRIAVLS